MVLDSMGSVGDEESDFNPLNLAHLVEGLHRDLESIGAQSSYQTLGFDSLGGYDMEEYPEHNETVYFGYKATIKGLAQQVAGQKKARKAKKNKNKHKQPTASECSNKPLEEENR